MERKLLLLIFIISIMGFKSTKALGGISGDILGAIAFLTELVFLFGIIIVTVTVN